MLTADSSGKVESGPGALVAAGTVASAWLATALPAPPEPVSALPMLAADEEPAAGGFHPGDSDQSGADLACGDHDLDPGFGVEDGAAAECREVPR